MPPLDLNSDANEQRRKRHLIWAFVIGLVILASVFASPYLAYRAVVDNLVVTFEIPEYLAKALALPPALIIIWALNSMVTAFVLGKRPRALAWAAVLVVIASGDYYFAQPKEGQLFNPISQEPNYRWFRESNNDIILLPRFWKVNGLGRQLHDLTPPIAEEYHRQELSKREPQFQEGERKKELQAQEAKLQDLQKQLSASQAALESEKATLASEKERQARAAENLQKERAVLEDRISSSNPANNPQGSPSPAGPSKADSHGSPTKSESTFSHLALTPGDPHRCGPTDADTYYANYGPAVPHPAGYGGLTDPKFLFPGRKDDVIYWAHGFTGTVPVCFIINEQGNPTDIRLLQSPGKDLEDQITALIKTWHYSPGTFRQYYLDETKPVPVQIECDFAFK